MLGGGPSSPERTALGWPRSQTIRSKLCCWTRETVANALFTLPTSLVPDVITYRDSMLIVRSILVVT